MGSDKEIMHPMQSALIKIVQDKDIDPARLEKFIDLQIKMENRQAEQAFCEALANFQGECPIITKTKKVEFKNTKYDYSPLDEIIHIVKPLLVKNGLSYSFNLKQSEKNSELITKISHKNGHSEESIYPFDTIHDDERMNINQRRKSSLTYAKRAGLENALGIVTAGEDDDARRASNAEINDKQIEEINLLMKETDTTKEKLLDFLKIKDFKDLNDLEARKTILALKVKKENQGKVK